MTNFKELCKQCARNGESYTCECCTESIHENCIFVTNFRLATEEPIKGCSNCRYQNLKGNMQPCKSCMDMLHNNGEWFSKWRTKNNEI